MDSAERRVVGGGARTRWRCTSSMHGGKRSVSALLTTLKRLVIHREILSRESPDQERSFVICAELGERKWAQDPAVRGVWGRGGSSAEAHSSQSVMKTRTDDIKHWTEVQEQQLCTNVPPGERGSAPPSLVPSEPQRSGWLRSG